MTNQNVADDAEKLFQSIVWWNVRSDKRKKGICVMIYTYWPSIAKTRISKNGKIKSIVIQVVAWGGKIFASSDRDLTKIEHRASDMSMNGWKITSKANQLFWIYFFKLLLTQIHFFLSQSTYLLLCRLPTSTLASQYSCDHVHDFAEI